MQTIPRPPKKILSDIAYLSKGEGKCFVKSLTRLHKELGDIYQLKILNQKWIVCSNTKIMKQALIENFSSFPKGATLDAAISLEIGATGLTETEGPEWNKQHKLLNPFFTNTSVSTTHNLIHQWLDKADLFLVNNPECNILDFCNRVSFSFITNFSSGYESKCLDDLNNQDPLFKYQGYVIQQFVQRIKFGIYSKYLPTPSNILYNRRKKAYQRYFKNIIENFKVNYSNRSDMILYHLINGKYGDRALSETEIIDQIYTVIGAGFESTGAVFHWFLYELALNPKVCDAIRSEIKSLGDHQNWTHDNISKCKLLQASLLEVLRLHPAFPLIAREVAKDVVIDDYLFPKKSITFFMLTGPHEDPFWGDDRGKFRPDRFFEEKIANNYKDYFYPFGIGPRKCIGEKMAKSEILIMVMRVVSKFNFEVLPNQKIVSFQHLSNISKHGIRMKFSKI